MKKFDLSLRRVPSSSESLYDQASKSSCNETRFRQKKCSGGNHGHQSSLVYELLLYYFLVFLADLVVFLALVVFVLFFGAAFLVAIADLHLLIWIGL